MGQQNSLLGGIVGKLSVAGPWQVLGNQSESEGSNGLCDRCSMLTPLLKRRPFFSRSSAEERVFDTGELGDILKKSHCGFCRMLLEAVRQSYPSLATSDPKVHRDHVLLDYSSLIYEKKIWIRESLAPRPADLADKVSIEYRCIGLEVKIMQDFLDHREYREIQQSFVGTIFLSSNHFTEIPAYGHRDLGVLTTEIQTSCCDIDALRECYQSCCNFHIMCKLPKNNDYAFSEAGFGSLPRRTQGLPVGMLVIDLEDMCIVPAPPDCCYMALSYVWGQIPFLHLTKSNISVFRRPSSLSWTRLPKTIDDAMKVAGRLGERYLWIDALCIVQDGEETKLLQLRGMSEIYSFASATIVACTGSDVEAGLPGLDSGSRRSAHMAQRVGTLTFLLPNPPLKYILSKLFLAQEVVDIPGIHTVSQVDNFYRYACLLRIPLRLSQ